jgi:hypothetical protein
MYFTPKTALRPGGRSQRGTLRPCEGSANPYRGNKQIWAQRCQKLKRDVKTKALLYAGVIGLGR